MKKTSGKISTAVINAAKIRIHMVTRFMLKGMQTQASEQKHTPAVRKTQRVEENSSDEPITPQMTTVIATMTAAATPNGAERLRAFFVKLPRTIPKFGSKVSRNDGKPIIRALISVS